MVVLCFRKQECGSDFGEREESKDLEARMSRILDIVLTVCVVEETLSGAHMI